MILKKLAQLVVSLVMVLLSGFGQLSYAHNKVVVIPLGGDAKPLSQVITVSKANGDFKNPVAAVNSITDASEDKPYLVVIGPGVYTLEQRLDMKDYVSISGSGEKVTKLVGTQGAAFPDQRSALVQGAPTSFTAMLSDMTIENSSDETITTGIYNPVNLSNVTILATGTQANRGIYHENTFFQMKNSTVQALGGTGSTGIFSLSSSGGIGGPVIDNSTIVAVDTRFIPSSVGVRLVGGSVLQMSHSKIEIAGADAIRMDTSSDRAIVSFSNLGGEGANGLNATCFASHDDDLSPLSASCD